MLRTPETHDPEATSPPTDFHQAFLFCGSRENATSKVECDPVTLLVISGHFRGKGWRDHHSASLDRRLKSLWQSLQSGPSDLTLLAGDLIGQHVGVFDNKEQVSHARTEVLRIPCLIRTEHKTVHNCHCSRGAFPVSVNPIPTHMPLEKFDLGELLGRCEQAEPPRGAKAP